MKTPKPPLETAPRPKGPSSAFPAWIIGLVGVVAILLLLFVLVSCPSPLREALKGEVP